jgi:hypothetical protein
VGGEWGSLELLHESLVGFQLHAGLQGVESQAPGVGTELGGTQPEQLPWALSPPYTHLGRALLRQSLFFLEMLQLDFPFLPLGLELLQFLVQRPGSLAIRFANSFELLDPLPLSWEAR